MTCRHDRADTDALCFRVQCPKLFVNLNFGLHRIVPKWGGRTAWRRSKSSPRKITLSNSRSLLLPLRFFLLPLFLLLFSNTNISVTRNAPAHPARLDHILRLVACHGVVSLDRADRSRDDADDGRNRGRNLIQTIESSCLCEQEKKEERKREKTEAKLTASAALWAKLGRRSALGSAPSVLGLSVAVNAGIEANEGSGVPDGFDIVSGEVPCSRYRSEALGYESAVNQWSPATRDHTSNHSIQIPKIHQLKLHQATMFLREPRPARIVLVGSFYRPFDKVAARSAALVSPFVHVQIAGMKQRLLAILRQGGRSWRSQMVKGRQVRKVNLGTLSRKDVEEIGLSNFDERR